MRTAGKNPIGLPKTDDLSLANIPAIYLGKYAKSNLFYRDVVFTSDNLQIAVMLVPSPGLSEEVHELSDQFLEVVEGLATVVLGGEHVQVLSPGQVMVVPRGTKHAVLVAPGASPLRLVTMYSPPVHLAGTIDITDPDSESPAPNITSERDALRLERPSNTVKAPPEQQPILYPETLYIRPDGEVDESLRRLIDAALRKASVGNEHLK